MNTRVVTRQPHTGTIDTAPLVGRPPERRLRVWMLMQSFYPRIGGAESNLQALIPELRRRGIDVAVVTRRYPGMSARAAYAGAPVFRLPIVGGRVAASLGFSLTALAMLSRHSGQVDLIHAHELLSPTTTAVLARRLFRRPVVAHVLRGGQLGDLAVLRAGRLGPLRWSIFGRDVDAFIAVSAETRAELRAAGVGEDRIALIPYGVDLGRFRPPTPEERRATRQQFGVGEAPVAAYVGRLEPEKRLDVLLDAWPTVRARLPEAVLLVAGDGSCHDTLVATQVDGVRFLGPTHDPVACLQAADCFVLPSETEGLPNALLEAMAAGLPCVTTAIGGSSEAVRDGLEGWLVEPGDVASLADALAEALSREHRSSLGVAARARASALYSLESNADRLANLYRQLVAARR
jgi:glycosyltransferase involved in cell wall biosynthesis